jgi:hypothetical protein
METKYTHVSKYKNDKKDRLFIFKIVRERRYLSGTHNKT